VQIVTPPADTTGPVISGAASLSLATHDATIVWTTDELSISTFEYGTTQSYGSSATLSASLALGGTAILTGLTPGTTYYYCIHAHDLANNMTNSCGHTFTTASQSVIVDTTPPDVSLITVAPITTTGVTINFTTSEVGNARVEYGTTAGYGQTTNLDTNLALTHAVALSSLTPNTLYHYRIITRDEIGNQTITSDETFTTESIVVQNVISQPAPQVVVAPTDTTAPIISGIGTASLGINDVTLAWNTNELATSTLEYGISQSYGSHATLSLSALLAHTVTLTGLTAGTTYYYCIHVTDLVGNTANACPNSFTTDPAVITPPSTPSVSIPADTTAPQISLITVAPITTSGATVGWTTSELATSTIQYGTTVSYGMTISLGNTAALTHSVNLTSLSSDTTYHYRITSTDAAGNHGMSADETFTTGALPQVQVQTQGQAAPQVVVQVPTDTTPPVISGMSTASLGLTDTTLVWTTNELAASTIEYGTTQSYGFHVTLPITALLAHTATLTGLSAGTTYYYCIHATDLAGNTSNSCPNSFTTDPAIVSIPSDATPPQISLITIAPLATSTATVTWTTSELATSTIQYGTTAGYGMTSSLGNTPALTHSINLTSLSPDTTYHYRINSTDAAGNRGISSDETFTTDALPQVQVEVQGQPQGQSVPQVSTVLISGIETALVSTSTVTIAWNTDLPSDSQIEYGNSQNFGTLTTLDSTLTTSHSVTIISLTPNTNYVFRVKSKTLGASVATVSTNEEFTTLNHSIPVVAPANIISVSSGSITSTGTTITWTTDKAAASEVEYGTNTSYGSLSNENLTLTTSHSVSLTDLAPGTTYHFRVESTDEVGNETFSEDYTFTTTGTPSNVSVTPPAPVITDQGETPIVDVTGVDGEVVFEINDGNPAINEDVVIERDGAIIYEGNSETFTDTNQTNGVTHNYTVFARSSGGGSSRPVNISVAAVSGVKEVKFNESGTLASSTPVLHFVKTFQKGSTDIEIEHLQELLGADGDSYPQKYVTGYFGALTEAALMRFQAKHRIPQTGIVDATTQKELNTVSLSETKLDIPTDFVVFDTDLKKGDQGDAVEDLQNYLITEGSYQEAIVSGYFGNFTHGAVKKFQAKYNIDPVSGIVGPKTRHKMQQLVGL
jgi:peptidoglycan hydrolase-like protein with peptidoglycan-binding domain